MADNDEESMGVVYLAIAYLIFAIFIYGYIIPNSI